MLLCLGHSCSRSWLFDVDLVHELALVDFLVIRHLGHLSCGWFSLLTLGCGGFIRRYTYVLLVFACCRSVLVLKVTHRLAGWWSLSFDYGFVLAMVKICKSFIALRCISFVLLTSILIRLVSFQKKKKIQMKKINIYSTNIKYYIYIYIYI